jgi:hypothetical protein
MDSAAATICGHFAARRTAWTTHYKLLKNNMKIAGIGLYFRWPSEGESVRKIGS